MNHMTMAFFKQHGLLAQALARVNLDFHCKDPKPQSVVHHNHIVTNLEHEEAEFCQANDEKAVAV
jgi:hypothetical protein